MKPGRKLRKAFVRKKEKTVKRMKNSRKHRKAFAQKRGKPAKA
jgi:hypothetical protein